MKRHVWHNLVAHMNTEKCRPSLSHSYHHGAASVLDQILYNIWLDSVVTYSPSYFGEHTYNVAYIRTTFSPVSFPVWTSQWTFMLHCTFKRTR